MVEEELAAASVPRLMFTPPAAVRLAPLPMVKVPELAGVEIAPVTLPTPFQLPPLLMLSVPAMFPPALKLMIPAPVIVALPLIVPLPLRVPALATLTVLAEAMDPLTTKLPAVMFVAPLYVLVPERVRDAAALLRVSDFAAPAITPAQVLLEALV